MREWDGYVLVFESFRLEVTYVVFSIYIIIIRRVGNEGEYMCILGVVSVVVDMYKRLEFYNFRREIVIFLEV